MNTLLVYPKFPDTFWSFKYALRFARKRAANPPLGLLTVAAMLPHAWSLRLVDLNVQPLTDEDLAWADHVFLSAMAVQQTSAREVISRCHAASVPIVAGGPLFTAEPERFDDVEHLVLGEAELTLAPFLADLAEGHAKHLYAAEGFAEMSTSPVPSWELLDLDAYATMAVQYSRGCPFDCDFCNVTVLLGHRPRVKDSGQILSELEGLYDRGWRGGVFFVDDNLIGNKKLLTTDLLPALIEWRKKRPGLDFNTEASINLADDPAMMNAMVEAGFSMVFVGIETPDADGLAECNKKHNLNRDMLTDVRRMQRAGLQVQGGFILGFDSDAPSSLGNVLDFVQAAGIVTAMVGLLQALPGTRLHERMRRAGRLLDSSSGDNVNGTTNIVPMAGMEALREGYKDGMQRLYAPKPYYRRVRTFLREFKSHSHGRPWSLRHIAADLMAFARSVVRLGIIGRERVEYWKLLVWTLLRNPQAFGLAVVFAIQGYHFRMTCEAHLA
jgi:radical SAM superfamily enzyme YgiQ (UPF0313 family)